MTIIIDCIGDPCPLPLIKAEKKMRRLEFGQEICLLVDHNCAIYGIPEWARKNGYKVKVIETPHLEWEIYIEKKAKEKN
ncbi:MAG: sulfurtransferase TusA family protein [Halanaerobium sp.]